MQRLKCVHCELEFDFNPKVDESEAPDQVTWVTTNCQYCGQPLKFQIKGRVKPDISVTRGE